MKDANNMAWITVAACALGILWATSGHAAVCGDSNGDGQVSVTDGVEVLRAAAGLHSGCSQDLCDLDFDGNISVTDGVLALRLAAGLSATTTCAQAEADRQQGRVDPILQVAVEIIPPIQTAVRIAAAARVDCAAGGFTLEDASGFQDFDCNDGKVVTNGAVSVVQQSGSNSFDVSFQQFSAHFLDTGELLTASGMLLFVTASPNFIVTGTISRSSTTLGDFTDVFDSVTVGGTSPNEGKVISGDVRTDVMRGVGPYQSLRSIDTRTFASGLVLVDFAFANGNTFSFARGGDSRLCQACDPSAACGDPLVCTPCQSECTEATNRCAPVSVTVSCQGGQY
jgi:hypothetical protein